MQMSLNNFTSKIIFIKKVSLCFVLSSAIFASSCFSTIEIRKQELINQLWDIGTIKTGSFKLKSGVTSPIYMDFRLIPSYPQILKNVATLLGELIQDKNPDIICGVPVAGLPLACAVSLKYDIPMIIKRSAAKDHGTQKLLEGVVRLGDKCIVIEDLVTSGISSLETVNCLEKEGQVKVIGVVAIMDREQGGAKNIIDRGYDFKAIFTMDEMLTTLQETGRMSEQEVVNIYKYISGQQISLVK